MNEESIDEKIERLENTGLHIVSVKVLKAYCNPFKCWFELESPITKKDILICLEQGKEGLVETPLVLSDLYGKNKENFKADLARENHIRKIAYFVKNKAIEPLSLDVGVPNAGCFVDYFLQDGNHRFAAAIIKNDKEVHCHISGSSNYIKELKLWNPNSDLKELLKLYEIQYEQENRNKQKHRLKAARL